MDQRIPVLRKTQTDLGSGQFRSKFYESVNSIYELSVEATQFSEDRMEFSWQAPGSQLVQSPEVYLDFELTVSGKGTLPEALADFPALRAVRTNAQNDFPVGGPAAASAAGFNNLVAFGPGDAFGESISSIQVVTNSQPVTSTERDKFWRSMMRAFVEADVIEQAYERAGGAPESCDAVSFGGLSGADAGTSVYGKTMETSLAKRAKQFINRSIPLAGDANGWAREIRIRTPICASLLHPFSGKQGIYSGSPFAKLPNAICNWSSGRIQILMRNMFSCGQWRKNYQINR